MARLKPAPARKKCKRCGKVKPIREFVLNLAGISGELSSHWSSYCRPCNSVRAKAGYYALMPTNKLVALEAKTERNLGQIRDELARREEPKS